MSNLFNAIATGVDTFKEREVRFQKRLELARSTDEADLVRTVSAFGLDGCAVLFREVCNNPATTLKVAEVALQELERYLAVGWDACAHEAQDEWQRKYVELVAAASDATVEQVKKARKLLSNLRLDWAEGVRLSNALVEKIPA